MNVYREQKLELLLSAIKVSFSCFVSFLESILKKPNCLREYDQEVASKVQGKTLFSFLMSKITDANKRHKICLLFLKYGYSHKIIIRFLIRVKNKLYVNFSFKDEGILMETICSVLFFFKEGESLVESIIEELLCFVDRRKLRSFFIKNGVFSKQSINFIDLMTKDNYCTCLPLIKGFLDASLTANRNVIKGFLLF